MCVCVCVCVCEREREREAITKTLVTQRDLCRAKRLHAAIDHVHVFLSLHVGLVT